MAEMKDSGVAWINTIPKEWELKKIKYTLQSRNENNNPIRSRDILSLTAKQGVIPLEEKESGGNKPKEDFSAYKLAYPGDIVMNSMNVLSGSVGLSKYFGCVSPVYYMLRPQNENDDVRYFNYIFQTTVFQRSLLGLGNGILMKESDNGKLNTIRMRIPLDKLGNLYIPVPDSATQKKIADYLDSIIPDIDVFIKDIEKQVEILEEYKKSVITEAVTKGLNPDVEMKDSGIEWIGEIPSNWKIKPIKYFTKTISKGATPNDMSGECDENYPYRFIKAENIQNGILVENPSAFITEKAHNELKRCNLKEGDLLFVIAGATIGKVAIMEKKYEPSNTNQAVCFIRLKDYNDSTFYKYVLQSNIISNVIKLYTVQSAQPNLSMGNIANIRVPYLENKKEQEEIVNYLDVKCIEIDGAIKDKKAQLETLEEYKKSLIYEYVTGKKEVPDNE